ncbi:MAG TPA: ATP-dependent helicase [Polyangia bacterium]|nr:ATP-dependent helicase [Polyangia bacterium]
MPFTPTVEQEAIIGHDLKRPARILAGPGTGKSATMIALLNARAGDVDGKAKLLTFTRAATAELVEKVSENPELVCERPSTLHSFCISVLLANPGLGEFPKPFRMADDWERDNLVESSLARRLHIRKGHVRRLFGELAANWESLAPDEAEAIPAEERARFMGAWQENRDILGYALPSELPYALLMALRDHPELAGLDYSVLVVDEYQDLNACDLGVLQGLAAREITIIGAGDDDQSVYAFRKAHPAGIREFLEHFTGAADYGLTITQRCGKAIVQWANHVIQGDPDRSPGRALVPAETAPDGEVALFSYRNERAEARGVAELASHLIAEEGIAPSEVLILLRGDSHQMFSGPIKLELDALGIPHSDPNEVKAILGAEGARRSLSHLRLIDNPEDSLAWATLLALTPGIGDTFFDYIYERARAARTPFGRALLAARADDFPGAHLAAARRAMALIDRVCGWASTIVPPDKAEEGWTACIEGVLSTTDAQLPQNLRGVMASVDARIEKDVSLSTYLNQLGPIARDLALAKAEGVRIMSLAGSKGLTVEATILVGLEHGIVPRDGAELAEERRLLYVGMTRAKKFLYGTWARRRRGPTARAGRVHVGRPNQVSRFLENGPVPTQQLN